MPRITILLIIKSLRVGLRFQCASYALWLLLTHTPGIYVHYMMRIHVDMFAFNGEFVQFNLKHRI